MYSLAGYGSMIADRVRMDAYAQALRNSVHHGSVVVEIGTGPGIFAVLACQLGASCVYAIEPNDIIQVAREIAAANRCADRIEFIQDISTRVTLPIQADVLISDLRGVLPVFQRHVPTIADARRRFLAPSGTLIPRKDRLWVAIVEAPKSYDEIVGPWERNPLGQDLSPALRLAVNNSQRVRVTSEQVLTKPQLWTTLDYATVETPDVAGELNWTVERAGTGHGILIWFDTDLADGVSFSNSPEAPEAIYGSLFLSWMQPVPLAAGQTVCVALAAKLMEDDYMWRWTTRIESVERPGETLARFDQSQLQGMVLSPAKLRKSGSDYVPQVSEQGRIQQRTLELMDGQTSLEEIARRLASEFPQRFADWQQALSYAGAVSQENSR